jgi:beta-mannosidase
MSSKAHRSLALAILLLAGGWQALEAQQQEGKGLWQPYYIDARTGEQHIPLDGNWQLGHREVPIERLADLDQQKWIQAEVPTSAQWALYQAGMLPYPYAHLNTRKYTWVPDKVWYWRREFEVPSEAKDDYVFLCFDGIGYYSRIWLNGSLIGRHEGMFGGPHVEVGRWLRFGQPNQITVEVKAASYGAEHWDPDATGNVILPWGTRGGSKYVTSASDIDPKELEPLGIWQDVRLEGVPKVHLARPFLVTEKATDAEAALRLSVEVLANAIAVGSELHPSKETQLDTILHWPYAGETPALPGEPAGAEGDLVLQIDLADENSRETVLSERVPLHIHEGRNWITHRLAISSPKLWWPNGMGKPNLYRVSLTLTEQSQALDRLEFDYGIRTIQTVPTPGPQTQDRWRNWQFVVNGRPLFIKGINWAWPLDVLLHLPAQKYRWLLQAAQAANIQLIRVWGGGNPETETFYQLCDRLGIMVWEDFPVANAATPGWPQDVWEAQVLQIIFRLRNHSSLAVWCGGNEFNPYNPGNTATVGIIERSVRDFDGTRMFLRTTPDPGDAHIYANLDPTWYGRLYRSVPFISETGIYNMPEPASLLEVVNPQELKGSFQDLFSHSYAASHPEFIHHLLEYQGQEPRTLLSRASQMDDLSTVDLNRFCDATQVAAAEFTQILSDLTQANYPVTTGLMPWSLTVPWPIEFFMFIDGFDQPTASYYALKRTYEPTHILVKLPELIWAKGEKVPISIAVTHAPAAGLAKLTASVQVLDSQFRSVWREERAVDAPPGPSVLAKEMGEFTIPDAFVDRYFFVVAELRGPDGSIVSRSIYWPRCLKLMSDPEFRANYRRSPQPSLEFRHGPWLRPQVAAAPTQVDLAVVSRQDAAKDESLIRVRVRNTGPNPAFDTHVDITASKRSYCATDSDFWLAPGEERQLDLHVLWREPATRDRAVMTVGAWNAEVRRTALPAAE